MIIIIVYNNRSQLKANKRFSITFQHTKRGIPQGAIREEVCFIFPVDKDFLFKKILSYILVINIRMKLLLETDCLTKRCEAIHENYLNIEKQC